jgi:hypothetical protein
MQLRRDTIIRAPRLEEHATRKESHRRCIPQSPRDDLLFPARKTESEPDIRSSPWDPFILRGSQRNGQLSRAVPRAANRAVPVAESMSLSGVRHIRVASIAEGAPPGSENSDRTIKCSRGLPIRMRIIRFHCSSRRADHVGSSAESNTVDIGANGSGVIGAINRAGLSWRAGRR